MAFGMVDYWASSQRTRWVLVALACAASWTWGCGHENPTTFIDGSFGAAGRASRSGAPGVEDPEGLNGDSGATGTGASGDDPQGAAGSIGTTVPSPTEAGQYDPDQVYLYGGLKEYSSTVNATSLVSSPNLYTVGFPPLVVKAQVWKNRVVYWDNTRDGVWLASPDYIGSLPFEDLTYPKQPKSNDLLVDTPQCPGGTKYLGPDAALAGPGDRLIYHCLDKGWYEGGSELPINDPYSPVALGAGSLVFVEEPIPKSIETKGSVLNLDEGMTYELSGLYFRAVRAHGDGFHVMGGSAPPKLWNVDAQGRVTEIGTYAPWRGDYILEAHFTLAANDDLYVTSSTPGDDAYSVIVRRTLSGDFDEVYSGATDPIVKALGAPLFTGP